MLHIVRRPATHKMKRFQFCLFFFWIFLFKKRENWSLAPRILRWFAFYFRFVSLIFCHFQLFGFECRCWCCFPLFAQRHSSSSLHHVRSKRKTRFFFPVRFFARFECRLPFFFYFLFVSFYRRPLGLFRIVESFTFGSVPFSTSTPFSSASSACAVRWSFVVFEFIAENRSMLRPVWSNWRTVLFSYNSWFVCFFTCDSLLHSFISSRLFHCFRFSAERSQQFFAHTRALRWDYTQTTSAQHLV